MPINSSELVAGCLPCLDQHIAACAAFFRLRLLVTPMPAPEMSSSGGCLHHCREVEVTELRAQSVRLLAAMR